MAHWHNNSGSPLASSGWLEAHHNAKLLERTHFAHKIISNTSPSRIVDLGCGSGLWLELIASVSGKKCELIGVDSDALAIEHAEEKGLFSGFKPKFIAMDFEDNSDSLPEADVYLAFNIFNYVKNPTQILEKIRNKLSPNGTLIIRQYDGGLLRFGPINEIDRDIIDRSLKTAVLASSQFKHYDLDRVIQAIYSSKFSNKDLDFEVFKRTSPYPAEFLDYYQNTLSWTHDLISEDARERLSKWLSLHPEVSCRGSGKSYFMEVDLVAWLS